MKKPVRQHGSSEYELKAPIAQALAKQNEESLKHQALDIYTDPATPILDPKIVFKNEEPMWRDLAIIRALQILATDKARWNYGLTAEEQLLIWQPWTI